MTGALLIDGGQSGCRVAYVRDGVVHTARGAGLARVGRDLGVLRHAIAELAVGEVELTAAGLTGFDGTPAAVAAVRAAVPGRVLLVTNDAVTAYLGALGAVPGAVIVAGTGAIALAAASDGRWARADGWGTMLGDDGGGYWIARRALALALRAHDGRAGSAALRTAAEAHFGPLATIARIYDTPDPVATIAAFTPTVAEVARAGDEAAATIWRDAGRELARTTAAAVRTAGSPDHAAPVSYAGALFDAGELLLAPFRAELARLCPAAEVRAPHGTGLDGAALLAERPPLFASLVHEATT